MILRELVLAICISFVLADYGKGPRRPKVIIKEAGPSVQYNWVGYTHHYPKSIPDPRMRMIWNPLTDPHYKASWVPSKKGGSKGRHTPKGSGKGHPRGFGPPKGSSLVDSFHSGSGYASPSVIIPTVPAHAPLPLEDSYTGPAIAAPAAPLDTYSGPAAAAPFAPLNIYSGPVSAAPPLDTYSGPAPIHAAPVNVFSQPSGVAFPNFAAAPAQTYFGPNPAQNINSGVNIIGPVAPSHVSSSFVQQDQPFYVHNNQPTIVQVNGFDNVQVPLNAYIGPGSVSSVPLTLDSFANTNGGPSGQGANFNFASPSAGSSFGTDPRGASYSTNLGSASPVIPLVRPPVSKPLPLENEGIVLTNSITLDGSTYSNFKRDAN